MILPSSGTIDIGSHFKELGNGKLLLRKGNQNNYDIEFFRSNQHISLISFDGKKIFSEVPDNTNIRNLSWSGISLTQPVYLRIEMSRYPIGIMKIYKTI